MGSLASYDWHNCLPVFFVDRWVGHSFATFVRSSGIKRKGPTRDFSYAPALPCFLPVSLTTFVILTISILGCHSLPLHTHNESARHYPVPPHPLSLALHHNTTTKTLLKHPQPPKSHITRQEPLSSRPSCPFVASFPLPSPSLPPPPR